MGTSVLLMNLWCRKTALPNFPAAQQQKQKQRENYFIKTPCRSHWDVKTCRLGRISVNQNMHQSVCDWGPPLLSMSVGLLVSRQLDDEHTGLSVLKAVLVVGRLGRALSVQHEDLRQREDMVRGRLLNEIMFQSISALKGCDIQQPSI